MLPEEPYGATWHSDKAFHHQIIYLFNSNIIFIREFVRFFNMNAEEGPTPVPLGMSAPGHEDIQSGNESLRNFSQKQKRA